MNRMKTEDSDANVGNEFAERVSGSSSPLLSSGHSSSSRLTSPTTTMSGDDGDGEDNQESGHFFQQAKRASLARRESSFWQDGSLGEEYTEALKMESSSRAVRFSGSGGLVSMRSSNDLVKDFSEDGLVDSTSSSLWSVDEFKTGQDDDVDHDEDEKWADKLKRMSSDLGYILSPTRKARKSHNRSVSSTGIVSRGIVSRGLDLGLIRETSVMEPDADQQETHPLLKPPPTQKQIRDRRASHKRYKSWPSKAYTYNSDKDATPQVNTAPTPTEKKRAVRIAAAFLMDYENSRPVTLPHDPQLISEAHLILHDVKFSIFWRVVLVLATFSLFAASGLDMNVTATTPDQRRNHLALILMTAFPVIVYALDIFMVELLAMPMPTSKDNTHDDDSIQCTHSKGKQVSASENLKTPTRCNQSMAEEGQCNTIPHQTNNNNKNAQQQNAVNQQEEEPMQTKPRVSRSLAWAIPFATFLALLSLETFLVVTTRRRQRRRTIWCGLFKPIALFYLYQDARDALAALNRVAPALAKVSFLELFFNLIFASVACQLYGDFENFGSLQMSFISMFELTTTVVNPSSWMPVYNASKSSAIFFVLFLVTSIFYFHSLVLSLVFHNYIQAMSNVRERYSCDREDAARLAFQTLWNVEKKNPYRRAFRGLDFGQTVSVGMLRRSLKMLRGHYCDSKIDALARMIDTEHKGKVDFAAFRARVPKALTVSLRRASSKNLSSHHSYYLDVISKASNTLLAVANMAFVVLLTNPTQDSTWASFLFYPVGVLLTFWSGFDLVVRVNPCNWIQSSSDTKRDVLFEYLDGSAIMVSMIGILMHLKDPSNAWASHLLFIGRTVDMTRFLRLFEIFEEVIKRTREVFSTLIGPVVLLATFMHISTYLGMFLWGGQVEEGTHNDELSPFYDLNNFNRYSSGLLTMFQILIVNDWHELAKVFLVSGHSPVIVYSFFITGNLVGVSILLNVVTAFFVGAFVWSDTDVTKGSTIDHLPTGTYKPGSYHTTNRPNFDMIMRTVTGVGDIGDDAAKQACRILEVFETLTPGREKVGYLVCCQHSMCRFGNRRFQTMLKRFMDTDHLHAMISEVHGELTVLNEEGRAAKEREREGHMEGNSVYRTFRLPPPPPGSTDNDANETLEIRASLLRASPSMSLFAAKIVDGQTD